MPSHLDRRAVRDQLDRFLADSSNELEFLRHRASGTVHIVVPRTVGPEREFRFSEVPTDVALDIALGVTHTLCGYVGRQNLHGAGCGDELVTEFADVDLCQRCHRVLGKHAPRAFEHRQPEQEGHLDMTMTPTDPATGFRKLPYGADPEQPTETVATYEHDGALYEIDHLGIANDEQFGEFAVYRDSQQIADFITDAAGVRPQFRPELPNTDELIELAKSAVADAEQE